MDRGAKSSGLPAASVSLAVAPCGQAVNRPGERKTPARSLAAALADGLLP